MAAVGYQQQHVRMESGVSSRRQPCRTHRHHQRCSLDLREHYVSIREDSEDWLIHLLMSPTLHRGAWLSDPLQRKVVGRRPALFVAALFCVATMLGRSIFNIMTSVLFFPSFNILR